MSGLEIWGGGGWGSWGGGVVGGLVPFSPLRIINGNQETIKEAWHNAGVGEGGVTWMDLSLLTKNQGQ